jgi:hypothetical protein
VTGVQTCALPIYCCQVHGTCPTCVKQEEPLSYTEAAKKEERMFNAGMVKQEKLKEAAERFFNNKKWLEQGSEKWVQNTFLAGANWQAERMYSEEEVRKMLWQLGDCLFNNCQNGIKEGEPETYFDDIISEFKNK